jgi:hypothetical protein
MKFTNIKEQLPPFGKRLLIGYSWNNTDDRNNWFAGMFKRPFDDDKKYNPDYIEYCNFESRRDWTALNFTETYWAEVDFQM